MAVLNKVSLIGHLGADPVVRYLPNGAAKVTINLATTETWKDRQSGVKKERTDWHRVVFFSGLAKTVSEYLKSGSQIYVEGKLRNRKWMDNNNVERYTTEIVVRDLQMFGKAQNAVAVSAPIVDEPPLSDDFDDY